MAYNAVGFVPLKDALLAATRMGAVIVFYDCHEYLKSV